MDAWTLYVALWFGIACVLVVAVLLWTGVVVLFLSAVLLHRASRLLAKLPVAQKTKKVSRLLDQVERSLDHGWPPRTWGK